MGARSLCSWALAGAASSVLLAVSWLAPSGPGAVAHPEPAPAATPDASFASASSQLISSVTLADGSQQILTWNPCRVIGVRIWLGATSGLRAQEVRDDVASALDLMAQATGLRFRMLGIAERPPEAALIEQDAELIVALVPDPHAVASAAEPGVVGYGAFRSWQWPTGAVIARGMVLLDEDQFLTLRPGFGPGWNRGTVLLHELAHVVGLRHSTAPTSLMRASLDSESSGRWSSQDLQLLRRAGGAGVCRVAPVGLVPDIPHKAR